MQNILAALFMFFPVILFSQELQTRSDTLRKDALRVFVEASDYVKQEITFINYVRDIKEADVYIISTGQETGAGGWKYTFFFVGQHSFDGMKDTLYFITLPDETNDMQRAKMVKTLKMGLMRYVAKTPLAKFMNITFSEPMSSTVSTDKWNNWVFTTSFDAYTSGQSTYNNTYMFGSFSANRITEKSKFESRIGMDYEHDKTKYEDTTYISSIKEQSAYISYIKSINKHWSSGLSGNIQKSTYSNYDLSIKIAPGIEYDVFPYSESTRRLLTFQYKIGVELNDYTEETIRFNTKDQVGFQSLSGYISYIQKWGSLRARITWSNYFFDWSYNNIRVNTSSSIRIFKGLNFNIYGSIAAVHDQISLPSQGASLEDALLRRKMQATQYSYSLSCGFSYTFGSIFNNVVNPRFD